MTASSWHFRSFCEEDLDKILRTTSRFILKQLDYSPSVSMRCLTVDEGAAQVNYHAIEISSSRVTHVYGCTRPRPSHEYPVLIACLSVQRYKVRFVVVFT